MKVDLYDVFYPSIVLSHEHFMMCIANIINLPGCKNKSKSVLEITKNFCFYIQILKINKMAIHTHVIFRPHNTISAKKL